MFCVAGYVVLLTGVDVGLVELLMFWVVLVRETGWETLLVVGWTVLFIGVWATELVLTVLFGEVAKLVVFYAKSFTAVLFY